MTICPTPNLPHTLCICQQTANWQSIFKLKIKQQNLLTKYKYMIHVLKENNVLLCGVTPPPPTVKTALQNDMISTIIKSVVSHINKKPTKLKQRQGLYYLVTFQMSVKQTLNQKVFDRYSYDILGHISNFASLHDTRFAVKWFIL